MTEVLDNSDQARFQPGGNQGIGWVTGGLSSGPDGNVWFVIPASEEIGMISRGGPVGRGCSPPRFLVPRRT